MRDNTVKREIHGLKYHVRQHHQKRKPCVEKIPKTDDPGGYWWPPTYSNWLLVSVFVQHVLLYYFVIVGSTLLGLSEAPHILQVDTGGLSPNPTGLFYMFSCHHIFLYFRGRFGALNVVFLSRHSQIGDRVRV
jgi:hypothetical protein